MNERTDFVKTLRGSWSMMADSAPVLIWTSGPNKRRDFPRDRSGMISDLLDEICDTTERAAKKRKQLFAECKSALLAHSHAELEIFYRPLIHEGPNPEALYETEVEHQVVERPLEDVNATGPSDEKYHVPCATARVG